MKPQVGPGTLPAGRPASTGATLLEVLIALGITGVISAGLYAFFSTTSQTYTDQAVAARMLENATSAMTMITKDIRAAGTFSSMPCRLEPMVSADNASGGAIWIRLVLDDPAVRTEMPPPPPVGQLQTNAILRVVSSAGFQPNDTAFVTDGVQCSRFTVLQVIGGANPGLEHNPALDLNSPGGAGYLYPARGSLVYRVVTNQRITYSVDASNPAAPWLTRDTGAGPVRLVPDIESLRFSYEMNTGAVVSDPTTITTAAQAAGVRVVSVSVTSRAERASRLVGGDGLRRRTLVSRIQLRNLGQ